MLPSSDFSRSSTPVLFSAPGLSVVALVLFVLFASLVAAALFPLQLLDPAWQLRLAGTLINGAPFPLLGLALLQIAALGFLLLLPLQTIAGLKTSRSLNQAQAARIQGAEGKLKALRQAVASAASNADLNQQLQKLSGPVLGPAAALAQSPGGCRARSGRPADQPPAPGQPVPHTPAAAA
jgi:hypothetical protein